MVMPKSDTGRESRVREMDDSEGSWDESSRLLEGDVTDSDSGSATERIERSWTGFEDFDGLPWWRKPSPFWMLGPFVLFTLAFGGVIVPKLNLILDLVCQQYFADQTAADPNFSVAPVILGTDNPQCKIPEVQRSVATFMLVMSFCTGLLSAIVAPYLGHLSDRYGRKRFTAFASIGGVMAEIITIFAAKFPDVVNYRWLILGSIFDGLTGSFSAGSMLTQAYTSDCTPPSKRAVSMGYIHACLFTGLAFGPLIAGYLVKWTGSLLSIFYITLGCHVFFIVFVGFVIPESLSKRRRQAAQDKWAREKAQVRVSENSGFSFAKLKASIYVPLAPLKILWPTGPGTSTRLRLNLLALAINDVIILGTAMAVGAVIMLYAEYVFDWGTLETSQFISAVSLVRVICLMGLFPLINYFGRVRPAARAQRLGQAPAIEKNSGADHLDLWILRSAIVSDMIGTLCYTLAQAPGTFVAGGMFGALGGMGSATIQGVLTKHVPSDRVGQLLGAIGMLHALTRVVGPLIFNGLYAATVGTFPQAVFVLLTALFGLALVTTVMIKPHVHWEEADPDESEPLNNTQRAFDTVADTLPIDEDQVRVQ